MKTIICDKCKKKIELKQGELFNLEVRKITDEIESYPENYGSDFVLELDLCKSCYKEIKKKIN